MRIIKLMSVYKCLKIPVTTTLLSFLCVLEISVDRFPLSNELKNITIEEIEKNDIQKNINILVNNIGYDFSENYKKCLIYYINEIHLNRYYFLEDILDKANEIIRKLLTRFNINDKEFEAQLLESLYLGILKKENKILKIGIEKERKVLVLIQETNLTRQNTLKKELEEKFITINFDIECNFFNFKHKYKQEYDYIIDDLEIILEKGDIFSRVKNKLQTLIIEKIYLD